ncbi:hypothetical protein QTN25_000372 [Entamoeba marina]
MLPIHVVTKTINFPNNFNPTQSAKFHWQWFSDKGYVNYDDNIAVGIENALKKKIKTVDVDVDRYIDFQSMTQRRKDNPLKSRKVRRVPPTKINNTKCPTISQPLVSTNAQQPVNSTETFQSKPISDEFIEEVLDSFDDNNNNSNENLFDEPKKKMNAKIKFYKQTTDQKILEMLSWLRRPILGDTKICCLNPGLDAIFEHEIFFVVGELSAFEMDECFLRRAEFKEKCTPTVSTVIVGQNQVVPKELKDKCKKLDIPIVEEKWLIDSIKSNTKLFKDNYYFDQGEKVGEPERKRLKLDHVPQSKRIIENHLSKTVIPKDCSTRFV